MPSAPVNALSETSTADAPSAKFHQDLANGLHAMAQPLTMLRAAIEVLALPQSAGIDRQRYLEISAGAVERTCKVFAHLQDLVTVSAVAADRMRFNLWEVIAPLIEDRRKLLELSGVAVAAVGNESWVPVVGDADRTEQALAAALEIAGDLASKGDVIQLSGTVAEGRLELRLENTRCHGRRVDSVAKLRMALAEANIVSQGGTYKVAEDPFRVYLALPAEVPADWGAGPCESQEEIELLN
jgi:signal transduction histidine kinase